MEGDGRVEEVAFRHGRKAKGYQQDLQLRVVSQKKSNTELEIFRKILSFLRSNFKILSFIRDNLMPLDFII